MREDGMKRDACMAVEPLLSSCAAGALDEAAEQRVRDHLAVCASCRAAQMERDPSVLFLELRRSPLPDGFLDTITVGVRSRLEAEARSRARWLGGFAAPGSRRLAYVAAPLMTLLLLGTLFLVRPGRPWRRGPRDAGQGAVSSPYVVPPGSARPGRPGLPSAGPLPPFVPVAPSFGGVGAPPLMEEVGSPSARVYRFTVESGEGEIPIYFVVDESIDI
jgi:hypothetical protein